MFEDSSVKPRFRFRVPAFDGLRSRLLRVVLKSALFIVPLLVLRGCAITYVAPSEIGLRQISFGPGRGLQKELVLPGYRRCIAGYETVQTFPRDIQVVEFTDSETEKSDSHRTVPAINVPTVDGYPVTTDITVMYRVADPFKVVSRFGFGRNYEDNVVIRFTDPTIKQFLGELRAEQFYHDIRRTKMALVKDSLSKRFADNGLALSDILIRQYNYPQTFQQLMEQKKIQDQSVLANRALAKQAEVETRLKQTVAQGQNAMSLSSAEFQARITGINAEKDLYQRRRHAEADLLVRSAEAQGTELINRAMEGAGSDKLLRLRKGLALLNGIKGPIYISEDPTDVGRIMGQN